MPLNSPASALVTRQDKPFQVRCEAGANNRFGVQADSVSVTVGQRVLRGSAVEMWESVSVYAKHCTDGHLEIEVLIFNPDWDEPIRIASIRSRPQDATCLTAVGCCLDHVGT